MTGNFIIDPTRMIAYGSANSFPFALNAAASRIKLLSDELQWEDAKGFRVIDGKCEETKGRVSEIAWLPIDKDDLVLDLIMHVYDIVHELNMATFIYNIPPVPNFKHVQLTVYNKGGHYGWHTDYHWRPPISARVWSWSLTLQKAKRGGGLTLMCPDERVFNEEAELVIFPSFMAHKANVVKSGQRVALVGWVLVNPY